MAPVQVNGKPPPQFGGVPVEQHRAEVAVTVRADRGTHLRLAIVVDGHAPGGPAMGAKLALPAGPAPLRFSIFLPAQLHRPEAGGVRVTNTMG